MAPGVANAGRSRSGSEPLRRCTHNTGDARDGRVLGRFRIGAPDHIAKGEIDVSAWLAGPAGARQGARQVRSPSEEGPDRRRDHARSSPGPNRRYSVNSSWFWAEHIGNGWSTVLDGDHRLVDDDGVHGYRSRATIDDTDGVSARSQRGHREHRLLGLTCARGGEIRRPL